MGTQHPLDFAEVAPEPEPPETPDESRSDEARRTRRRRRWRVLIAILLFMVLIVAGLAALVWQRQSAYNNNVDRIKDALPTDANRPGPGAVGSENWILVGSDTRATGGTTGEASDGLWETGKQRSDTIMLLHLPADRDKAFVLSFPRDSWVDIPGYGNQKINAAFSYGGPKLLIRTVESLTGIRIDHFGAIDFAGFKSMTNALGGVTVDITRTVSDPANHVTWQAGKQKLNGDQALLFVRQRYGLPNGDFDRIRRQQAFLRALAKKAADGGTITNPFKLDGFLTAFTKSISVDDSVTGGKLRSLALGLRGLRIGDVSFLTLPNKGSAQRGKQSVVLVDPAKAKAMYEAMRGDTMGDYIKQHGGANNVGTAVD